MVFMRTLGGLIAATVVGLILGAIKDYLHLFPEVDWAFTWPFAMGGAAFVGALMMALMRPVAVAPAGSRPAMANKPAAKQVSRPAQGGAKLPTPSPTSQEVPGMPTFDFDQARNVNVTGSPSAAPAKPSDKPTEMS
jgi:hypothetical protein